jgi:hypothetical protein
MALHHVVHHADRRDNIEHGALVVGMRDSDQNPKETPTVFSLGPLSDRTTSTARHKGLDLNVNESIAQSITAKDVGVGAVTERDRSHKSASTQFGGNKELSGTAAAMLFAFGRHGSPPFPNRVPFVFESGVLPRL